MFGCMAIGTTSKKKRLFTWLFAAVFSSIVLACNPIDRPTPTSLDNPVGLPSTTAANTPTSSAPVPTPTSTTEPLPSRAILLAPEVNPDQLEELHAVLDPLIAGAGLTLEERTDLTPAELSQDIALVVAMPPAPEMEEMVRAAPGTQFLALGIPGLTPAKNLTLIGSGSELTHQGFMAGVMAAAITGDWRIGTIVSASDPSNESARQAFVNGGVYFCGLCRQVYPPYIDAQGNAIRYPLSVEMASGSETGDWQSAADYLIERGVQTIFLNRGVQSEALLMYLSEKEINVIGGERPPAGAPRENRIATLHFNPLLPIEEVLPSVLLGQGGTQLSAPLQITDIHPVLFTPARQMLVESILEDLLAGYIDTGVNESSP